MTLKEAYRAIAQLEDCTLRREKWTHNLHLITGMYMILSFGKRALPEIKERIWRYNDVMGKGNVNTGYHETLTVFWLWAVREFCLDNNIKQFDQMAINNLLAYAPLQARKIVEDYYEEVDLYISRKNFMYPSLKEMADVDFFFRIFYKRTIA